MPSPSASPQSDQPLEPILLGDVFTGMMKDALILAAKDHNLDFNTFTPAEVQAFRACASEDMQARGPALLNSVSERLAVCDPANINAMLEELREFCRVVSAAAARLYVVKISAQ